MKYYPAASAILAMALISKLRASSCEDEPYIYRPNRLETDPEIEANNQKVRDKRAAKLARKKQRNEQAKNL